MTSMRCTRKGCGKEYTSDSSEKCTFHPGAPVFHEGLKSWSCCSDVYKPVLEFEEFTKIPGCTQTDKHTSEATKPPPETSKSSAPKNVTVTVDDQGNETYTTGKAAAPSAQPTAPAAVASAVMRPAVVEEEEDMNAVVDVGTSCKHKGCSVVFASDDVHRLGDGQGTICVYHPSPPIFREGSKGYLCCKRRVLEFDEFLKIEGCKKGRHLFVPKSSIGNVVEQMTTCRIDHYQTVDKVHVSIFAKKADKERSQIKFEENHISLDIYLPDSKRFSKTVDLFGPIDPDASSFTFFGTKVELVLQKSDSRSWTILEKTDQNLGNISLTFGVGGRTGTVGSKTVILDESNKAKAP